jgi:hypothetical protein
VSDGGVRFDVEQWAARADEYAVRVETLVARHVKRARAGEPHPVWDFLFSYYRLRPAQLRCWHPGYGVLLAGGEAVRRYRGRRGYTADAAGATVSKTYLYSRLDTISFVARLLRATARRPVRLNCFGLHEWAMVYRSGAVRHDHVPLRLGAAATDTMVEAEIAGPLRCSHFDAFRFFSADAAPRNTGTPSRETQQDWEQPGCLHANMDLYRRGQIVDVSLMVVMAGSPQSVMENDVGCASVCPKVIVHMPVRWHYHIALALNRGETASGGQ